jgi:hypothetical protein
VRPTTHADCPFGSCPKIAADVEGDARIRRLSFAVAVTCTGAGEATVGVKVAVGGTDVGLGSVGRLIGGTGVGSGGYVGTGA